MQRFEAVGLPAYVILSPGREAFELGAGFGLAQTVNMPEPERRT